MMEKIIIEARVNELEGRNGNPNVPFTPSEVIRDAKACYDAGASMLPILIHPTLGYVAHGGDAKERFEAVEQMMKGKNTAPHFAPTDVGSVNVDWWDPENNRFDTNNLVYENSTKTVMYFSERIKHYGLKQYLVSWNVSFTRQIEAFIKMGVIEEPAFVLFCMTDGISLAGHPGTPEGLDAHTTFLPKDQNILWSAMNYKGNLFLLTEKVIKSGGHISIGLGDYHYPEFGKPTNADLIEKVVEQARAYGREVATVDETRAILKMDTA